MNNHPRIEIMDTTLRDGGTDQWRIVCPSREVDDSPFVAGGFEGRPNRSCFSPRVGW